MIGPRTLAYGFPSHYMLHAYLFPDFYFPKDMGIMIGQCTLTYGFPSHYMHISFRTCSVFTIANPSLKEFYLRQAWRSSMRAENRRKFNLCKDRKVLCL
jgi:hypothetical protein